MALAEFLCFGILLTHVVLASYLETSREFVYFHLFYMLIETSISITPQEQVLPTVYLLFSKLNKNCLS